MEIFYIVNTINEYSSEITRYCSSLESAKSELKNCCDWYRQNGTGKIYKVNLDTNKHVAPVLVYQA